MAQPVTIDLGRSEEAQTRTELTLGRIGRAWKYAPRGEQFTQGLLDFLRSLNTEATLRSYSFSILQFFDWYEREHRGLPTPDNIRRADAVEFNKWLRTRSLGLEQWRLEHDPVRRLDLAVFEIVKRDPAIRIGDVRQALGQHREFMTFHEDKHILSIEHPDMLRRGGGGLAKRLACLVLTKTLVRSPSLSEIRRGVVDVGLDNPAQADISEMVPPEVYQYFVPEVTTPEGAERASTIATRLSALSALWRYFMQSGENIAGQQEQLLKFNIWLGPLKEAQQQAPSHRAVSRAKKTPNVELFLRLLATTFYRSHGRGPAAVQAAHAQFWGRDVPSGRPVQPSFSDLRDRALLILMAQIGARAKEIFRLRNSDVAGDPPVITLLGKRGKRRSLQLPPVTVKALAAMRERLAQMASHQLKYRGTSRAEALLGPNAPLLPAISYWGANNWKETETGLTRAGIAMMLRRRAEKAGIDPGSADFPRAHPHGMRHLFAKIAAESGTPMNRIQAIMGHASAATTGRYMEERAPEMLVAEAFRGVPAPERVPTPPPEPYPVYEREVPAITPPAMPKAKPITPRAPPREAREPEYIFEPVPEEEIFEVPFAEEVLEEPPAPPLLPAPVPTTIQAELRDTVWRTKKPISEKKRSEALSKCSRITSEALRRLCLIYLLHWGEQGNAQALRKSGGRLTKEEAEERRILEERRVERAERLAERGIRLIENPNGQEGEEFEEWEEEEEIPMTLEELEEEEVPPAPPPAPPAPVRAVELGELLVPRGGTDKTKQVYLGKQSGLPWWYGTHGKLRPQMPVMSPAQAGRCSAAEQDEICVALIGLWMRWNDESDTKSEALLSWIAEALDAAAQLDLVVRGQGIAWVPSAASWSDTLLRGTQKRPEPRLVYREHLPAEIINWFKAVGWQYRGTAGGPAGDAEVTVGKVRGEKPPDWYEREDPILDLPYDERAELLDWLTSLTGQRLPTDTRAVFPVAGTNMLSTREKLGVLVNAMCEWGKELDAQRGTGKKGDPGMVSKYLKAETLRSATPKARSVFGPHEDRIERAMFEATAGAVRDFDIRRTYKARTESHRHMRIMAIIGELFGPEAAEDAVLKNVARCGKVPLAGYRELFHVANGTISHDEDFKIEFAGKMRTHSECVGRRAARELWELFKARPGAENITRPRLMVNLIEAMRAYKVPCTELQEMELRSLLRSAGLEPEPMGVYRKWQQAYEVGREEPLLSEAEEEERGLAEQYQEEIRRAQAGAMFKNVPTPVHLLLALRS